jgi:hypothetical protein
MIYCVAGSMIPAIFVTAMSPYQSQIPPSGLVP